MAGIAAIRQRDVTMATWNQVIGRHAPAARCRPPLTTPSTALARQLAASNTSVRGWRHFFRPGPYRPHGLGLRLLQTYDIWFRPIFAFFIVGVNAKRVVHMAVTRAPTQAWTAQQLRNATRFGHAHTHGRADRPVRPFEQPLLTQNFPRVAHRQSLRGHGPRDAPGRVRPPRLSCASLVGRARLRGGVHDAGPGVHHPDPGVHDGPIFAFTMRRTWRSRSRGTRTRATTEVKTPPTPARPRSPAVDTGS